MLSPLLQKRLRRAKDLALAPLFRHFYDAGSIENTVLLASSPRSGSTWLQELLNHDGRFRIIFEPFLPRRVPQVAALRERQYLGRHDTNDEVREVVEAVLRGHIRSRWADRFNRRLWTDARLIKDVRCNLMLGWIREKFPQIRIVFLLRHPCAVVSSRMKMGWDAPLDVMLAQPTLICDELAGEHGRDWPLDPFERQVHAWCIENLVPLRHLEPHEADVFFYEELCIELPKHLPRLLGTDDASELARVEARAKRPSALAGRHSAVVAGTRPHSGWTRDTTPQQRTQAAAILESYGLDRIYGEEVLPRCSSSEVLTLR